MSKSHKEKKTRNIRTLLLEEKTPVRIINFITLYRIVTFPILLFLILIHQFNLFKWLLLASFFTDAIDGYLARRYNATSVLGAKLDSIGDDLTVLAAVIGLCVVHFDFIEKELTLILILFGLFFIQLILSLSKYKKMSSFHTYLAKTAAVVTAVFLLSAFFLNKIVYPLFYASFIITALELIEETIIVLFLPTWKTNVKGLYWVLKGKVKI
jgi:CDP-diacylglycerol--glycerol-3-phosphate 3-phosphatidyltransferase